MRDGIEQERSEYFSIYKEIKAKNQALKATTFSQFWKKTTTSQHRLLSSFDIEKRRIQVSFLKPKFSHPILVDDHKNPIFSFNIDMIHPIDKMDFHKQSGEMLYNTITNSSMAATKVQFSINNIQSQLKLERISSLAKETKIKSFEYLFIKLGYDPNNITTAEEIINNKNSDIEPLRKHINLPSTEDPWMKEYGE